MPKRVLATYQEFGLTSLSLLDSCLQEAGASLERLNRLGPMPEHEFIEALKGYETVISCTSMDTFNARVMDACAELKVISRHGVGYEHIDISAARERGIYVCTTHTGTGQPRAVADLAMGMIIALARRLIAFNIEIRKELWHRPLTKDLFGSTLGIIGVGRIGKAVARRARPFGFRLLGHDILEDEGFADEVGLCYTSLEHLLAESDFVSIHLPLTEQTKGLMNRDRISQMKPGAILINTARGPILDDDSVYEALVSGQLSGAGIDVWVTEPPVGVRLLELDNVLATPHVAAYTENTIQAMDLMALLPCLDYHLGKRPRNVINGL